MELAGRFYTAYRTSVGGLSFNGTPLPNWDQLVTDPTAEKVVKGWRAVAGTAAERVEDAFSLLDEARRGLRGCCGHVLSATQLSDLVDATARAKAMLLP
jgi:hypothetical protein